MRSALLCYALLSQMAHKWLPLQPGFTVPCTHCGCAAAAAQGEGEGAQGKCVEVSAGSSTRGRAQRQDSQDYETLAVTAAPASAGAHPAGPMNTQVRHGGSTHPGA